MASAIRDITHLEVGYVTYVTYGPALRYITHRCLYACVTHEFTLLRFYYVTNHERNEK